MRGEGVVRGRRSCGKLGEGLCGFLSFFYFPLCCIFYSLLSFFTFCYRIPFFTVLFHVHFTFFSSLFFSVRFSSSFKFLYFCLLFSFLCFSLSFSVVSFSRCVFISLFLVFVFYVFPFFFFFPYPSYSCSSSTPTPTLSPIPAPTPTPTLIFIEPGPLKNKIKRAVDMLLIQPSLIPGAVFYPVQSCMPIALSTFCSVPPVNLRVCATLCRPLQRVRRQRLH